MNYSPDFFRNFSSVPFRPPRPVKRGICYLNLLHSQRRLRFLQTPTFTTSHWLPLKKSSFQNLHFHVKKTITYLTTHLTFLLPPRKRLRSTYSPSNSTYTKSALSYCGPLLWNSLPPNLTSITSLLTFHKPLKLCCSNSS